MWNVDTCNHPKNDVSPHGWLAFWVHQKYIWQRNVSKRCEVATYFETNVCGFQISQSGWKLCFFVWKITWKTRQSGSLVSFIQVSWVELTWYMGFWIQKPWVETDDASPASPWIVGIFDTLHWWVGLSLLEHDVAEFWRLNGWDPRA